MKNPNTGVLGSAAERRSFEITLEERQRDGDAACTAQEGAAVDVRRDRWRWGPGFFMAYLAS